MSFKSDSNDFLYLYIAQFLTDRKARAHYLYSVLIMLLNVSSSLCITVYIVIKLQVILDGENNIIFDTDRHLLVQNITKQIHLT